MTPSGGNAASTRVIVESTGRVGSVVLSLPSSDHGAQPQFLRVQRAKEWSHPALFDLTEDRHIPVNAVVTGITFTYDRSAGSFSMPDRVVVDDAGRRALVNRLSGRTDAHNGKPVRQRWYVQFRTETIWRGPALIWPVVTIFYEY